MIIINLILGFLLFWLLLNALKWVLKWFIIYKLSNLSKNPFRDQDKPYQTHPSTNDNQTLVQCARCGIYIVQTQAIERSKHYYCSKEHLP